jgi:hypothetical protein
LRFHKVATLAVAVLLVGSVSAQDFSARHTTTEYVGAGAWPLTAYFGLSDAVTTDVDLRVRVSANFLDVLAYGAGVDVLARVASLTPEANFYVGGGPYIGYADDGVTSVWAVSGSAVGGLSFRFAREISVFAETGPVIGFGQGGGSSAWVWGVRAALGVLYHY